MSIILMNQVDNVGLSRITINNNFLDLQTQINSIQSGLSWAESVLDITDAAHAVPAEGNRYIASETSGGWTENYVYEFRLAQGGWVEWIPPEGTSTWVESVYKYYVYNGNGWVEIGGIGNHNSLGGLNSGDFQHLTQVEKNALTSGNDANIFHKHINQVSVPLTFPSANGIKQQWAVDLTEKLFYFCINTNLWVRWTIETAM